MNITIENLIHRLQAIAKINKDEFRYSVEIQPRGKEIIYLFNGRETADSHIVFCGSGESIDDAVNATWRDIEDCCKEFGYKCK